LPAAARSPAHRQPQALPAFRGQWVGMLVADKTEVESTGYSSGSVTPSVGPDFYSDDEEMGEVDECMRKFVLSLE